MAFAPDRSVPSRRSTATDRPQLATPITLGVTDPDAIATFLRGVPLDAAFWRRFRYQCSHCHEHGTTVCGALWRVSLEPDCQDLYYLHCGCLAPYKIAHGLRSVEGRRPLASARMRRGPEEVSPPQ